MRADFAQQVGKVAEVADKARQGTEIEVENVGVQVARIADEAGAIFRQEVVKVDEACRGGGDGLS